MLNVLLITVIYLFIINKVWSKSYTTSVMLATSVVGIMLVKTNHVDAGLVFILCGLLLSIARAVFHTDKDTLIRGVKYAT